MFSHPLKRYHLIIDPWGHWFIWFSFWLSEYHTVIELSHWSTHTKYKNKFTLIYQASLIHNLKEFLGVITNWCCFRGQKTEVEDNFPRKRHRADPLMIDKDQTSESVLIIYPTTPWRKIPLEILGFLVVNRLFEHVKWTLHGSEIWFFPRQFSLKNLRFH